jgi:hypothetical protein
MFQLFLLQAKEEAARDLMDTRTTSTTTLHRLDTSPAPSSTLTARRSVRQLLSNRRRLASSRRMQLTSPSFHVQTGSSRSEELRFRLLCPVTLVGAMIGRVRGRFM